MPGAEITNFLSRSERIRCIEQKVSQIHQNIDTKSNDVNGLKTQLDSLRVVLRGTVSELKALQFETESPTSRDAIARIARDSIDTTKDRDGAVKRSRSKLSKAKQ